MFDRLIASRPRSDARTTLPGTALSIMAHAGALGVAVAATLPAGPPPGSPVPADTTAIVFSHVPRKSATGGQGIVHGGLPVPDISESLADAVSRLPDLSIGLEDGLRSGGPLVTSPPSWRLSGIGGTGDVALVRVPDEPPSLVFAPTPRYPETLRAAGFEGLVEIEAVIDTTGRAEAASLRVARRLQAGSFRWPTRADADSAGDSVRIARLMSTRCRTTRN